MKERLDIFLVEKGYFETREKAKRAIMAGVVFVNGLVSDKPGMSIDTKSELFIKENPCPYVSRGGLKLKKAIESFDLCLSDVVAMDIGASTGGFTDCMLQEGARKIYTVDVGYGQLDYKLRNDPRIVNLEKVNIRYLEAEKVPDMLDFISIDVSFISLKLVLPVAAGFLKEEGKVVCLIKPQFEAGKEQVGKKGIVREASIHEEVIEHVIRHGKAAGFSVRGLDFSPVTGAKGNIEYLMYFQHIQEDTTFVDIGEVVKQAHVVLR